MPYLSYREYKWQIEKSPSASFWLKDAVGSMDGRDPLDAMRDAELLFKVCRKRAGEIGLLGKEES